MQILLNADTYVPNQLPKHKFKIYNILIFTNFYLLSIGQKEALLAYDYFSNLSFQLGHKLSKILIN